MDSRSAVPCLSCGFCHQRPVPRESKRSGWTFGPTAGGPSKVPNTSAPRGQEQHCEGSNPRSVVGNCSRPGHRMPGEKPQGRTIQPAAPRSIGSGPPSEGCENAEAGSSGCWQGSPRSMAAGPTPDSAMWPANAEGNRTSREASGPACRVQPSMCPSSLRTGRRCRRIRAARTDGSESHAEAQRHPGQPPPRPVLHGPKRQPRTAAPPNDAEAAKPIRPHRSQVIWLSRAWRIARA